jgi:uncharacterized protein (UPF0332 family)
MKNDYNDLIENNQLKREPDIRFDQIEKLFSRSLVDLKYAEKNLKEDGPITIDLTYKSIFHASIAVIRCQGFRPGDQKQHKGIFEAIKRTFGSDFEPIVKRFNRLRIQRNDFEYKAIFESSETELVEYIKIAKEYLDRVQKYIEKENPQEKLFK